MSDDESQNSKKNASYMISEEEDEEEEQEDNKINDNSIKKQSITLDHGKNNIKLNNNNINKNQNIADSESENPRKILRKKDNNVRYENKETQKDDRIVSSLLNNHKTVKKIKLKDDNDIIKTNEENNNKNNNNNKIKELLKKIKILEEELSSANKIINEKDAIIIKLTKTNTKLQNSLELISKHMDEKISNINIYKNRNINTKLGTSLSSNNNSNNRSVSSGVANKSPTTLQSDDAVMKNKLNEKELKNAVNMIRILTNDNKRLQNKLDELEKNNEIEKEQKEKEKISIDKELQEHKICKEKMEQYKDKIRKLSEKIRTLLDQISTIKLSKKSRCIFQIKNNVSINNNNISNNNNNNSNNEHFESEHENSEENNNSYKLKKKVSKKGNYSISFDKNMSTKNLNNPNNIINFKKSGFDLLKIKKDSLPKINTNKNKSKSCVNYNNINNLNTIFSIDEMKQLNQIFKNNENMFNIIVKKIEIMQKSKDSLSNKYKLEKKQYIERIYSMQQHIDYLNGKIRENEFKINILQSQLNENTIHKKQLLRKIKILSAGLEFSDYSNNNIENINKSEDKNNNEETNTKATNKSNNNTNNAKKKKTNGVKRHSFAKVSNENNSVGENNHNNSEDGETILEENVSEASSKHKALKLINDDESNRNDKTFYNED